MRFNIHLFGRMFECRFGNIFKVMLGLQPYTSFRIDCFLDNHGAISIFDGSRLPYYLGYKEIFFPPKGNKTNYQYVNDQVIKFGKRRNGAKENKVR